MLAHIRLALDRLLLLPNLSNSTLERRVPLALYRLNNSGIWRLTDNIDSYRLMKNIGATDHINGISMPADIDKIRDNEYPFFLVALMPQIINVAEINAKTPCLANARNHAGNVHGSARLNSV